MTKPYVYIFIFFIAAIFPAKVSAESGGSGEDFRQGLLCYGEINFTCALESFTRAEIKEKEHSPKSEKLVEIYKYKAFSEVALGDEKAAEQSFKNAFLIDPDFYLDKEKVSPGIYEIYQDAKNQIEIVLIKKRQKEEKAEREKKKEDEKRRKEQQKIEKPKPAPLKWLVGFNVGASFTLGEDTDYFDPGFGLELDLLYRLHKYFAIGAEIAYQRNGSKSTQYDSLNIFSFAVKPAFILLEEKYIVKVPVSLGLATYGFGEITSRQGMILKPETAAYYRINKNIAIGGFVALGTVIYFQDSASSWFINTGVSVLGTI